MVKLAVILAAISALVLNSGSAVASVHGTALFDGLLITVTTFDDGPAVTWVVRLAVPAPPTCGSTRCSWADP